MAIQLLLSIIKTRECWGTLSFIMLHHIYLEIINAYSKQFNIMLDKDYLRAKALEWSITRGARSGRVAWQFIQHIAGETNTKINLK